MKVVTIVRTLNEEENIARFCLHHRFSDLVLVADGGSTDRTVEIAAKFDYVRVRKFEQRIPLPDGSFMNPEPAHFNSLIDWATEEGADWVVYDDCDSHPNRELRQDARYLMEFVAGNTGCNGIMVNRLYLWGQAQYFPKASVGANQWAWMPERVTVRCQGEGNSFFETVIPTIGPAYELSAPPYCLLHHYAPNEEAVQEKMRRYEAWGRPQTHPLKSIYAPPETLPEWARE